MELLFVLALGIAALVVVPVLLVKLVLFVVLLPFKLVGLVFKVLFGVVGVVASVLMAVVGVVFGVLVVAFLALLLPLLPLLLIAGIWLAARASRPPTSPSASPVSSNYYSTVTDGPGGLLVSPCTRRTSWP